MRGDHRSSGQIPCDVRAADPVLRSTVLRPTWVIEHLESAEADNVPSVTGMIPDAEGTFREGVPGFQVSDVIRREGNFVCSVFAKKLAHAVHVLAPIQVALRDEILQVSACNFIGVREIVRIKKRARYHLPGKQR